MLHHNSATRIQRTWKRYIAPKCLICSLPVLKPHSMRFPGYCKCSRCPGCLKFSIDNMPCSITCEPWFPPMDNNSDYEDDKIYEKWIKNKPVNTEHLEYYDSYEGDDSICAIS